ncbi:MAG: hypothetical protein P4M12_13110 [Gammaproteobacteria bacterium]|nr:hypothetical protein [Gammaproteobacteria bacterium]
MSFLRSNIPPQEPKERVNGEFAGWAPHNRNLGFVKRQANNNKNEFQKYVFHISRSDGAALKFGETVNFELFKGQEGKVFAQDVKRGEHTPLPLNQPPGGPAF